MSNRQEVNFRFNLYENKKRFHFLGKLVSIFAGGLLAYCLIINFILNSYSKSASVEANTYYFEKSPDIIAVFTGDKGRLEYAFNLIQKYPEAKLLISGVYNKNTIQTFINAKKINLTPNIDESEVSQIIELDYQAKNTVENVLMTLQYIKKDQTFKNILIISSDYHLLRIKLLIDTLNKDNPLESIHYYGVESENKFLSRLWDSTFEGFKILRSVFFSFFWISDELELQV